MPTKSGYIERIKFRNEDNGYSIIEISNDDEDFVLVGTFNSIDEGEYIIATGDMKLHPIYGEQLLVKSYEIKEPEDDRSIQKYLSSGAIKGIGEALAKRIVKYFKSDTLRIMEEEPERLSEVKGISEKMAISIGEQVEEKKEMRDAMLFLQKYGISMNLSMKIYREYGARLYSVIMDNPYKLADDITGVGFKIADEIAEKVGIKRDDAFRIKSGISYVLSMSASMQGHLYLPLNELLYRGSELLSISAEDISEYIMDMQIEKRIIVKKKDGDSFVYLNRFYYMELNVAKMLHDINIRSREDITKIYESIEKIELKDGIVLDELQKKAVLEAVSSGLLIITGGPGTGKTTVINSIIKYFEEKSRVVLLAAPTGRAAKRMTETCSHEAKTIHRLLEINGMPDDDEREENIGLYFERNETNPLEADVIIIDEMSMVDINLFHAFLSAVTVGTRVILVGDINQLPSVGPGNVLKDIIESECFNVVKLNKIYRQAAESDIVVNAHKIIDEERIDLAKKSKDFIFIRRNNVESTISAMLTLMKDKLPPYLGIETRDIQVMTPMRKGPLGVERLNEILQNELNKENYKKQQKEIGKTIFRIGDKVMQVKNDYKMEWELRNSRGICIDNGVGVYNGDSGIIREINEFANTITVEYDDNKFVEYSYSETDELELAYSITIHKSQGSEYPAVIIPMFNGPKMLMTRNLIYTAITRAKNMVILIGSPDSFYSMVGNMIEMKRYSGLKDRLKELNAD